ncbi:MAG TPA: ComEA family DNA-binding protein [Actinophytocola sp.]|uniref:ComEA family DNA-binding protein n=1 Tax=Actinophytocola sp. TaxID=1872138 RepID=UPI002DBBDCD1|nr:ComEA family DNA-binding protein [Actinophytocola sp.]HEU5474480.1 ComEA family DNA-binding protein [Actinophytocola sp.]
MLLTTTRRADREFPARSRLTRMSTDPGATPPNPSGDLAADQEWLEAGTPSAQAEPRGAPWWRRGRPGRLVERWLPGADPPRRRLSFGLLAGLALVLAVAVGVTLSSGGVREPPPGLPVAQAVPDPAPMPSTAAATGGSIVVSVAGRVVRPGLVTLPDGARVADAVQAAGGPAPGVDLSMLNIARRLTDGEQINVGIPAAPENAVPAAPDVPDKVDLNTASPAQLDALPGVGAVTAQRIVDWRIRHGRFIRVEQLREIDGIGPARYGQLKDLVAVR